MDALGARFNTEEPVIGQTGLERRTGIAADSTLQYLGIFLDTIGRLTPYVVLENPKTHVEEIDGLNKALKYARAGGPFNAVQAVFLKLDDPDSWWNIGFGRGAGVRQRITHYPDLVMFQGSGFQGQPMKAKAYLHYAYGTGQGEALDFVDTLTKILAGACEWLDELEAVFLSILTSRAGRIGQILPKLPAVSGMYLPVNMTGVAQKYREDFLHMPICIDSAPFRSEITYRFVEH
jgi:hypothetical protein